MPEEVWKLILFGVGAGAGSVASWFAKNVLERQRDRVGKLEETIDALQESRVKESRETVEPMMALVHRNQDVIDRNTAAIDRMEVEGNKLRAILVRVERELFYRETRRERGNDQPS